MFMSKRLTAGAAGAATAIIVAVAAVLSLGQGHGSPLTAHRAGADSSADQNYGFIDQTNGGQLRIQLNSALPDGGSFSVGVPGVGLLKSGAAASIALNGDGSHTATFSGSGTRDAGASVARPLGYAFVGTGTTTPETFSLSANISADGVSATWSVTLGSTSYPFSAGVPQHNADAVVAGALQAMHDKAWHTYYGYLSAGFQGNLSEADFTTQMTASFPAGSSLASWVVLPSVKYHGEPGPGLHTATDVVTATFASPTQTVTSVARIQLVLDAGDWRITSMGKPVAPTIVSPAAMHGWGIGQETATATGALVAGPGTPPFGLGSAKFHLSTTGGGELLGTQAFASTRLDAIQALNYSTYVPSASPSTMQTPSLQFDMDYDLTDANTAWQGRLVFEPYFTETVTKGVWQTWDPLAGKWWATGSPGNTKCPQANPCTWAKVLQEFPNAGIRASVGGLEFKAGSGWPANFDGYVDGFVIVTNDTPQAFDFEAAP
jgi:hypothetical protein